MTKKIGNGSIPLRIGRLIDTTVYGGPYRKVPEYFWGVKMAEEIDHPHMVAVDTRDFSVPKVTDLKKGIVKALMAMINEEDVYAGCMGGIGRTGIFLAALAKVQIEYRRSKHRAGRGEDPVLYVRKHFIPHAVETKQQEEFIANLDVSDIVQWLDMTQATMGLGGLTPAKQTFREEINATENGKAWEGRMVEPLMEVVERDLDWVDSIEADSADLQQTEDAWVGAVEDLQGQIEDLQEQVDSLITDACEKPLTKQSWFYTLLARFK